MNLLVGSGVVLTSPATAKTIDVVEGEDLFAVLENLEAGDEVIVHEGTYSTQSGSDMCGSLQPV